MLNNLSIVGRWAKSLGLLPVTLAANDNDTRWVLLNGAKGNFCLNETPDIGNDFSASERSNAWSVNVGHFVSVDEKNVSVQSWMRPPRAMEVFRRSDVDLDLSKFHRSLEQEIAPSEKSVVSHLIRIFRKVRTLLPDGETAITGFLGVIDEARSRANDGRRNSRFIKGIQPLREGDFSQLVEELLLGRRLEELYLDPSLMLRHVAGQVFQEAHYEISNIDGQLSLEGFPVKEAKTGHSTVGRGVHFTPAVLARTVVEQCLRFVDLNQSQLRVLDPACGSAEFLRESIRQLRMAGYKGTIQVIGRDVSSIACQMADFVLLSEKHSDKFPLQIDIRRGDSLEDKWPQCDILLMNPPFLSYENLSTKERELAEDALGDLTHGRIDLALAFFWKAISSARNGTLVGTVIPSSIFGSTAAKSLRAEVADLMSPLLVARLGSQVIFPGAMVDSGIYVGKKDGGKSNETALELWTDYRPSSTSTALRQLRRVTSYSDSGSLPLGDRESGFSIHAMFSTHTESLDWTPRPLDALKTLIAAQKLPTVGDLFSVKSGVRTGLKKAFILSAPEMEKLPKRERRFFRPAVLNGAIHNGRLLQMFFIFYPYGDQCIDNERELKKLVPHYYSERLIEHRAALLGRSSKRREERWWEMSESRQWQVPREPKLVSVYFGDAGSFAWDSSGDFVAVGGFAWLPKKPLGGAVLPRQMGLSYVAILASDLFSDFLSATSKNVGGGQWDLSARFVNRIPMPNLKLCKDESVVNVLSTFGQQLATGKDVDKTRLEEAVRAAYGLADGE